MSPDTAQTSFPRIIHKGKNGGDGSDYKRCSKRVDILRKYIRPESAGAELGVFTGAFVDWLLSLKPSKLYIVDLWYRHSPTWEWAEGQPSTLKAFRKILRVFQDEINLGVLVPVVESIENFLVSMPRDSLDWVYIDSSHGYKATVREILLACFCVQKQGFILGDDCNPNPDPSTRHTGVYRAVSELEASGIIQVVEISHKQFAAKIEKDWEDIIRQQYQTVIQHTGLQLH